MRVVLVAGAAVAFTATLFAACAHDAASPPAGRSPFSNEEEDGKTHHVPHSCLGAEMRINLPQGNLYPAAVLRQPEFGAERPPPEAPEPAGQLSSVGRAADTPGGEVALAVAHAIEDGIRDLECGAGYEYGWRIICRERDGCATSPKEGEAIVERIGAIVTPTVTVHLDTCACRAYY